MSVDPIYAADRLEELIVRLEAAEALADAVEKLPPFVDFCHDPACDALDPVPIGSSVAPCSCGHDAAVEEFNAALHTYRATKGVE